MAPSINALSHLYWMSKLIWLFVFMMVFLHSTTQGLPAFMLSDCILSSSEDPKDCEFGAFDLNMNKSNCPPRISCYRNISQTCQIEDGVSNCLPSLVCDCHKCREVRNTHICVTNVPSPFTLPKRMKPIYSEYVY